jgi:hypothetical protein
MLEDDPLPFELRLLEVQDEADPELGDSQIIQHQPAFVVTDAINDFGVDDYCVERDQVGNEESDLRAFIIDIKAGLLPEGNSAQLELHYKSVLIRLLYDSVAEPIQNLNSIPRFGRPRFCKEGLHLAPH